MVDNPQDKQVQGEDQAPPAKPDGDVSPSTSLPDATEASATDPKAAQTAAPAADEVDQQAATARLEEIMSKPERIDAPAAQKPGKPRPIVVAAAILIGLTLSVAIGNKLADHIMQPPTPQAPIVTQMPDAAPKAAGGLLDMGEEMLKQDPPISQTAPDQGDNIEKVADPSVDQDTAANPALIFDARAEGRVFTPPSRDHVAAWLAEQANAAEETGEKIRTVGDMALSVIDLDDPARDMYLTAVVRDMGFDPDFELWVTNPDTVDAVHEATKTYARAQTAINAIYTVVEKHPDMDVQSDLMYMMAKAGIESNFNFSCDADGSSGKGIFQFIESTWLTEIHHHGHKYGLGDYADAIKLEGGKPVMLKPELEAEILALRYDPYVNAAMAVEYTLGNDAHLQNRLPDGYQIGHAERYLAHWLGRNGATDFMDQYLENPGWSAPDYFRTASSRKGNRSMFYFPRGGKRSFAQVHAKAEAKITDMINKLTESRLTWHEQFKDGGNMLASNEVDLPPLPSRKPSDLRM